MTPPLVSIIVLNWNGAAHVHRCLEFALAQSYRNCEIIVVDNGSTDGSIEKLQRDHPALGYCRNGENIGFAAGMNQGFARSAGGFVIPLNQDVCLHEHFVARCVERISRDGGIGAIGGRVFSWVGDQLTDIPRKGEGEKTSFRKRFQGQGGEFSDGEALVFMPTGSYPFLRRSMLEDLKSVSGHYYDEAFVTGWEDVDLFFRMHLRGWQCLFYPEAFGWHVGSGSVGGNATLLSKKIDYQVRVLRNRYFAMIKNLPAHLVVWLLPHLVIAELSLVPYFLVRSPKTVLALLAAWYQTLASFPELIRKRGAIQKNVSVGKGYLKQYFQSF